MNLRTYQKKTLTLAGMLAAVSSPDFAALLAEDAKATNLKVVKLRQGMAVATYENNSTKETVRIFVRDAGVIARDLPGEGPTRFHLARIEPVSHGFLAWYCDGRQWPDIRREYYRPEPWEVVAWDWSPEAVESIAAGALVLREIGKASCRGCGKPHWQHERDDDRKACVDCDKPASDDEEVPEPEARVIPAKWNYKRVTAERGTVVVGAVEVPTWWCAGMTGTRRKCVKIDAPGAPFFIDDEDGRGTAKVYFRGGGPDSPHASLPVDDAATFQKTDDGPVEVVPVAKADAPRLPFRKAARNGACPCGSGVKFKHCCGKP